MSDEMLVYPTGKVVAIAPDQETLTAVHEALGASGVDDDRVEVLCGEGAAQRFETNTDDKGPVLSAIRTVQKALGEETKRLETLNNALEAGAYVVQVAIPDHDDDDLRHAEKRSVGNALHDAGAQKVAFYGKTAVEELQIGA